MTATILDGRPLALQIEREILAEVDRRVRAGWPRPGLAAVLIGDDAASHQYVRTKSHAGEAAGVRTDVVVLAASTTTEEVVERLRSLNAHPEMHGIIVQLPLPPHLDRARILAAIDPAKDVDGLTTLNAGRLALGTPHLTPATPAGILELLQRTHLPIAGRHAVIVGRSALVGRPLALLLLQHDATVTICHSKTKPLAEITRLADILVAAVGQPGLIVGSMVKVGAVVVDVGTSPVDGQLRGDVDRASVEPVAGYLTPVPGGVGPLTVAMLLRNTLQAARAQQEGSWGA